MSFWGNLFESKKSPPQNDMKIPGESGKDGETTSTGYGKGKINKMTFFFDSQYPPYSEPKVIKDLIEYFKLQNQLDPSVHITTRYGHVPAVPEYYSTGKVPDDLMAYILVYAGIQWKITDEKALEKIRTYCFKVTDIWGVLLTSET